MDFAANFTAIDFETANRRRDSACQLAAVRVRDGQIVNEQMWMIRPRPLSFSPSNIQIHGITPGRVREELEFGDLWDDIAETIGDDCIVAHNASFDIGVLIACLRTHRKPIPELHFTCTRAVARRTWPHRRRYGLKPLSDWLGVQFKHHDALEDSVACAKILLAAGIDKHATTIEDLEKRLRLNRGKAGSWGYQGATASRSRKYPKANSNATSVVRETIGMTTQQVIPGSTTKAPPSDAVDMQRLLIRAEFIRALDGKRVVFSGRFENFDLDQARNLAVRLGGVCQDSVSEETDFVVVGKFRGDDRPPKTNAPTMSEAEFLGFLVTNP